MKTLNEEQYERIAGWLDGEAVELSGDERAAAEEIRSDEAHIAAAMEMPAPRAATDRARRRLTAALAHPKLRWRRVGTFAAASAAAAALLAVLLWQPGPQQPTTHAAGTPGLTDSAFIAALEAASAEDEIDLISNDLDEVAADITVAAGPAPLEMQIDALEKTLDEFYINDILSEPIEG